MAKLVEAARVRDAAGYKIAKELEGKVTRKVVKQTVMTIVYGVTFIGGRLQIERQLKDLDVEGDVLFKGSYYLANKVFASIGEMFTAARGIQASFREINKTHGYSTSSPSFSIIDRGKIIVDTVLVLFLFHKIFGESIEIYFVKKPFSCRTGLPHQPLRSLCLVTMSTGTLLWVCTSDSPTAKNPSDMS